VGRDVTDGCGMLLTSLLGVGLLYVLGDFLHQEYGWSPIFIVVGIFVGLYAGAAIYARFEKKRTERRDRVVACRHGVMGAAFGNVECEKCKQEREQEELRRRSEELRKQRDEETTAAQRQKEREEQWREWLKNIRMPSYLQTMHPLKFEELVCDLFRRMGYEVEPTPPSGDSGVDAYLRQQGQLRVLQCKRVKDKIGAPILRDLFGTMQHVRAVEGILTTTGHTSDKASEWAKGKPIRIIELEELVTLIRQHYSEDEVVPANFEVPQSMAVSPPMQARGSPLNDTGDGCPRCGRPLRVVHGSRGDFLGCSGYPACNFARALKKPRPIRY
jgi:hypothetical protein